MPKDDKGAKREAPPASPDDAHNSLVDALVGGTLDELDVPAPAWDGGDDGDDDKPVDPPITPNEDEDKKEETVAEDAPADPTPSEPPADTPTPPPAYEPEDDDGELDASTPEKTRKRFEKLRAMHKQAEEEGAFGRVLSQLGRQAQITPDQMANWVHLATRLAARDPQAIKQLQDYAAQFGGAPAVPATPAAPSADPAEAIYQKHFAAEVASFQLEEDYARRKAKEMAATLSQPNTVPATPTAPATPPAAPSLHDAALQEVNAVLATERAKNPEFDAKVYPVAYEMLQQQYARDGVPSPLRWVADMQQALRQAKAKAYPAPDRRSAPPKSLPANRTPVPNKPAVPSLEDVAAALVNGSLDDL